MAWFKRLQDGLQKTRTDMVGAISELLTRTAKFDAETVDDIEEILVRSDIGIQTTLAIIDDLRSNIAHRGPIDTTKVLGFLRAELKTRLTAAGGTLALRSDGEPTVILVVGINGSGKTTTIAKLAGLVTAQTDLKVTFAAADTFRAAAIEQLEIWAQRVKADVIKHRIGADPSAVVFDAIDHIRSRGGILFIDTAGRLQTKHNLMEELKKIDRTVTKKLGRPADERLLVLDATGGQNGISQARLFHAAIDLTGIVLTKLDGTAKGGVVVAIRDQIDIPIKYIGVGESKEDLHLFDPDQFVEALFANA